MQRLSTSQRTSSGTSLKLILGRVFAGFLLPAVDEDEDEQVFCELFCNGRVCLAGPGRCAAACVRHAKQILYTWASAHRGKWGQLTPMENG